MESNVMGQETRSNENREVVEKSPEIQKPKDPVQYTASISAIGDILAHNSVYEDAQTGPNEYDFTKMFAKVKPFIESADITVANSESIIGGKEIGLSSYPQFNSPYELGDALKEAGIDVVNLANNHTLDRGEQAILNATNHWEELGIPYVGASTSVEESEIIKTVMVNNITFSFLGYTYGTNGLVVPTGKEYLVNYIDEEKIADDIERAKELSDVVVLNIHIGEEYVREFNDYQDRIAQLAADHGAHIVFAHHPHVLQPAKWYVGVNGNKTFVIHSLGNFLAAQDQLYCRIGALLQLDVTKTIVYDIIGNEITSIEISNPRILPTYTSFHDWRNYEIIPMYQLTNTEVYNSHTIYEDLKQHMSQHVQDLQFIEEFPSEATSLPTNYSLETP